MKRATACPILELTQHDDNVSVFSPRSSHSNNSSCPKASTSPKKERLKAALLARKKPKLARARAAEEAEEHRRAEKSRRKLRNLEKFAALTELEKKIEEEYDEKPSAGLSTLCTQRCITPLDPSTKGCFPKGPMYTVLTAEPPTAIKLKLE